MCWNNVFLQKISKLVQKECSAVITYTSISINTRISFLMSKNWIVKITFSGATHSFWGVLQLPLRLSKHCNSKMWKQFIVLIKRKIEHFRNRLGGTGENNVNNLISLFFILIWQVKSFSVFSPSLQCRTGRRKVHVKCFTRPTEVGFCSVRLSRD